MSGWVAGQLPLRQEQLFGDRVVTCRADRPTGIHAMFRAAVARAPDREALVAGDLRLTWSQLDAAVAEVAAGLVANGVNSGDRVCLFLRNRAEFVVLFHAISRAGAIVVPISAREQGPGVAHIVSHCGARLLIYEDSLTGRLPAATELQPGTTVLLMNEPNNNRLCPNLRSKAAQAWVERAEEETAIILYTSGTTGKPKGAMLAEVNAVHAALIYEHVMELREGDRIIAAVPMSHVTGIAGAVVLATRCAGTLIVMSDFDAPGFVQLASRERMNVTILVPAMYALILARCKLGDHDLSAWRVGCYGGAPMPGAVIQSLSSALPGLQLLNFYGSTETMAAQAIMPPELAYERREDVGLAVPGAEILIMDDNGREVERGQPGEIWMRNATVTPGYWNDEGATRTNIVGGFWRSGDLGTMDENGFVTVLDRIKDMINRGGYKIYTAEVESVLAGHPAVLECAVVAKPCEILGERVHAFVTLKDGSISYEELARYCAERLADYKRPETFTILNRPLLRNANGKLLKREMRQWIVLNTQGAP